MPKAKPISLHPLTFEEAIKALVLVDPKHGTMELKRTKSEQKSKHKRATEQPSQ